MVTNHTLSKSNDHVCQLRIFKRNIWKCNSIFWELKIWKITDPRLAQGEPACAYVRLQTRVWISNFMLRRKIHQIKLEREIICISSFFKYFEWILLSILLMLQWEFTYKKYKPRLLIVYNFEFKCGSRFQISLLKKRLIALKQQSTLFCKEEGNV